MRILTDEQIKRISNNKNVSRCSAQSIRYRKDFKARAVRQYNEEGLAAVEIFRSAGFDLSVIGKRTPNRLMNQWNGLCKTRYTGKPTPESDKMPRIVRIGNGRQVRTLEAKVSYLQAKNDFLAELRARKRQ